MMHNSEIATMCCQQTFTIYFGYANITQHNNVTSKTYEYTGQTLFKTFCLFKNHVLDAVREHPGHPGEHLGLQTTCLSHRVACLRIRRR